MKKLLLIIDPQVDFITGSLAVLGADSAMDGLADYIRQSDGGYVMKIITADCHPYDHCSFVDNGGEWPRHCVHDTVGAAIWPAVFTAAYATSGGSLVLHKGERRDAEEYSIFQNASSAAAIIEVVENLGINDIDICGIAGDVCVLSSLRDGMRLIPGCRFRVLERFTPSIDGGKCLADYMAGAGVDSI